MKRYLSRIIGSESINHVTSWGQHFPVRANRQCKGPEVERGLAKRPIKQDWSHMVCGWGSAEKINYKKQSQ